MLPFLDLLVKKDLSSFVPSVYRKPTFAGLHVIWDSFTPKSWKINLAKRFTHRALMICSDSRIEAVLKKVARIFLKNGYPKDVISDNIKFNEI